MPRQYGDIEQTAAVIRGGKYPFKNFKPRDRAYLTFWATLIERNGGPVTLKQIADSGEFPDYNGSKKPHDGGEVNRLVKAGYITKSADGNAIDLTERAQLATRTDLSMTAIANHGAQAEVSRQRRLGAIASRPDQSKFSENIRLAYHNRCAITGCETKEALEAAHIKIDEKHELDFNALDNGILLRSDIHALFDAGLITLTVDGLRIELGSTLRDASYEFLRTVQVFRPKQHAPAQENIAHYRKRFGF